MLRSIREQIVCHLFGRLKAELPDYDVRRQRLRPVDKQDRASISINVVNESVVDGTIAGEAEVTATIEVVLAAMTDEADAELDPVLVEVHRVLMAEDEELDELAEMLTYTGCSWSYQEGGEGMAVVATMTFEVLFRHPIGDMATA